MKKILLLVCGFLLLALGAVGIFLPVLPTTPFVLLAATCFSCCSEKMYAVLHKSRLFGPYIEHYRGKKGVPAVVVARALILLWTLLSVSAYFLRQKLWALLLLGAVGVGVTIHLLSIRAKKKEACCADELPKA